MDANMRIPAGESIKRGAELAIEEINQKGGVLGRELKLVTRDHRGIPARGQDNILEFSEMENLVAILGGLRTPVSLAELPLIHDHELIYLVPWAAGTTIIDNGYSPNYAFRISVRDEFASEYLLKEAQKRNYKTPCILLENTGWGRSNEAGFKKASQKISLPLASIQWFNLGTTNFQGFIKYFEEKECDVIMLVASSQEGWNFIQQSSRANAEHRLPIISHWGITGSDVTKIISKFDIEQTDLIFLQTHSFLKDNQTEKSRAVLKRYLQKYEDTNTAKEIIAPVGTAHSYDLIHLLAIAIETAGTIERPKVREALEKIDIYDGLIKKYSPPFSLERHDALSIDDFSLARYATDGAIIPEKIKEQD